MPQAIDNDLEDYFKDFSTRPNLLGLMRQARGQWDGAVSWDKQNNRLAVRVYYEGVLTNANAPKAINLRTLDGDSETSQPPTRVDIVDHDGNLASQFKFNTWTNLTSGLYTADISSFTADASKTYFAILIFAGGYERVAVNSKLSFVTDLPSNYPRDFVEWEWTVDVDGIGGNSMKTISKSFDPLGEIFSVSVS